MLYPMRTTALGLLVGAILLGAAGAAWAQPPGPGGEGPPALTGVRGLLQNFFQALQSGDLTLLRDGGAISGTVSGDEFVLTLDSGASQAYPRSEVASLLFGGTGGEDALLLLAGDTVSGDLQQDTLTVAASGGSTVTLGTGEVAMTILKLPLPDPGSVRPRQPGQNQEGFQRPDRGLFRVFEGLRAQNIFALFAQSLTAYDMAVFGNGALWSGTILNDEIAFESPIFGTLSFSPAMVSTIEFGQEEGSSDFILLTTGDRISGTLGGDGQIQFQPVGLADASGAPLTLVMSRDNALRVSFKQPLSAFGSGGGGPGFGGGPGS